ncbi:DUF1990 family protein [Kribbella deserti]|uniref:DUF1990 family protein n=1 Tax=Kribbella deserti TaxID=1926257 RepID=A0ABV6QGE7_9ACTN
MKLADLEGLEFSYDCVGCTEAATTPPGYHRLEHRERLGEGPEVFRRAASALMTFEMHRASGIGMTATSPSAEVGTLTLGRLGPIPVPCKIVRTMNDPAETGFAYGTLQGHPEAGEESFTISQAEDGSVWFTLLAYSRPGTWYTRLAGPIARLGQSLAARRYATALRRLAQTPRS